MNETPLRELRQTSNSTNLSTVMMDKEMARDFDIERRLLEVVTELQASLNARREIINEAKINKNAKMVKSVAFFRDQQDKDLKLMNELILNVTIRYFRNMKGIVDISEFFRKLNPICHWANPFKDFKWSNVSWAKLSLFSESDDTFTSLQALSNFHYLFSGFMDYFWSRKLNISNFGPTNRNEMCGFGKAVDNDPNYVMSFDVLDNFKTKSIVILSHLHIGISGCIGKPDGF
uniref:Uncharacterized protein n=1 Tax=Tanacetum cinerariifolium TaxID=118510 RepID=A0A6L2KHJ2_TANCI|nr:hypothetical protein [Tanacetum cinerariifolium]